MKAWGKPERRGGTNSHLLTAIDRKRAREQLGEFYAYALEASSKIPPCANGEFLERLC